MSLTATKLLSLLVYPLSLGLLLGLLGLALLGWRFWLGWSCVALALGGLYLSSTAPVADALMGLLEREYPPRAMSVIERAPAIVLLGGGTRGDTHMGTLADLNQHADRLVHAVALFRAGKAPLVLISGGAPRGGRPEAQQMRDVLRVMGLPDAVMLLETESLTTDENALYTARLLAERDIRRVLLVTSAFHMRRAAAVFRARGVEVIPAPTDYQRLVAPGVLPRWLPSAGNLSRSTIALHELVGYEVYRWQGRLAAPDGEKANGQ